MSSAQVVFKSQKAGPDDQRHIMKIKRARRDDTHEEQGGAAVVISSGRSCGPGVPEACQPTRCTKTETRCTSVAETKIERVHQNDFPNQTRYKQKVQSFPQTLLQKQ